MAMITLKGRTKNIANRSKKYLEEALYNRLFKEGGDEITVRHQLNLFLKSRKRVYKWEVGDTIKKLRDRKHYYAALKVCLGNISLIDDRFNLPPSLFFGSFGVGWYYIRA